MYRFDISLSDYIMRFSNNELIDKQYERRILFKLAKKPFSSKQYRLLNFVNSLSISKDSNILDFGTGTGYLVALLRFSGYSNTIGVDIKKNKSWDAIEYLFLDNETIFTEYNGKDLPFPDELFNAVVSNQVLEHVNDVESYFSESARTLKSDSRSMFNFPHRIQLYDTHSQTWFVHYFPKHIRRFLYGIFAELSPDYYEGLLNLRSPKYYVNIANKYFEKVKDVSLDRLNSGVDLNTCEGNKTLRLLVQKIFEIPFIGKYVMKGLSYMSELSLIVQK